ncbi:MAG: DUF6194 family protein [Anaerolineales bacterium]
MSESSITKYITQTFPNVETTTNFGYTFFFYREERIHAFATIASTGNAYEIVSRLDRPGVYRLNIGVSRETFKSLFGAEKVNVSDYDFTALDTILPHPDYSAQFFVCVLSPSDVTFERIRPLLAEAYEIAIRKFNQRSKDK